MNSVVMVALVLHMVICAPGTQSLGRVKESSSQNRKFTIKTYEDLLNFELTLSAGHNGDNPELWRISLEASGHCAPSRVVVSDSGTVGIWHFACQWCRRPGFLLIDKKGKTLIEQDTRRALDVHQFISLFESPPGQDPVWCGFLTQGDIPIMLLSNGRLRALDLQEGEWSDLEGNGVTESSRRALEVGKQMKTSEDAQERLRAMVIFGAIGTPDAIKELRHSNKT